MDANSNFTVLKQAEIKVGPSFLKAFGQTLYNNSTPVILARELLQNSRDATTAGGSIDMTIETGERNTINIVCADTGIGMDERTLLDVFLTVGPEGSSKSVDSVGGYGVAKVALFTTQSWFCHTRDNFIDSDLRFGKKPARRGTVIDATVKREHWNDLYNALKMILSSDCPRLRLNGEPVKRYRGRREFLNIEYADNMTARVWTAGPVDGGTDYIFYRVKGLTQYFERLNDDYGFNVIVDFDDIGYRPSETGYPFSMSREAVRDVIREAVMTGLRPLLKNKLTARARHASSTVKRERIVHNDQCGYIMVDKPNLPASVRKYHRQIMNFWGQLIDLVDPGSRVGMLYSETTSAQRRTENGHVYYMINPEWVANMWDKGDDPVSFIWVMWHLACHEVTHKFYADHDETFTCGELSTATASILAVTNNIGKLRIAARKPLDAIDALRNERY